MKIIAIDSSGLVASAAVMTEDSLLAEYTVNHGKTHSQTLLPMLAEIIRQLELDMSEIDAIAVAAGPGSFTGLRIGSATAKGIGLVLDKPIISVPTVDALAYQFFASDYLVCPMMDARRSEVYTGIYEHGETGFNVISGQKAVPLSEIIEEVNKLGRSVIFLGDGADAYRTMIAEIVKVPYKFAPPHMSRQRAGAVGALAIEYWKLGKYETADEHVPIYLRMSQAERESAEKTTVHAYRKG